MNYKTNNKEAMSEMETYFWIVQLCSGNPEGAGIIVKTELVTKKWERVLDVVDSWKHLIDSGDFFANVLAMEVKAEATFTK